MERIYGEEYRVFTLPQEVDEANAEARIENGVLVLTLPKKSGSAAKKLDIRQEAGGGAAQQAAGGTAASQAAGDKAQAQPAAASAQGQQSGSSAKAPSGDGAGQSKSS
jgi:hypothetical protein